MAAVVKCLFLVYLLFNVCYYSSPVIELLETVMCPLNDCSRFYPHTDPNMAENLIVCREVAEDSVRRLVIHWIEMPKQILPLELLVRQIQYLLNRWEMFAGRADSYTSVRPIRLCQLYGLSGLSASNGRVGCPAYEVSKPIKGSF